MITYVKVCFDPGVTVGDRMNREGVSALIQKDFVLREFEHLYKHSNERIIREDAVVCDEIKVISTDSCEFSVVATVGKTRRNFHFNNVIWNEVDDSEENKK